MTIHATFIGRVVEPAKTFGDLLVIRAVSNEKKGGNYDSVFVDIKLKASGFDGQDALKYQKGDDITAIGKFRKQPWKNSKDGRYSYVLEFGSLETPWAIKERVVPGAEVPDPDPNNGAETAGAPDPFADIPL